MGGRAIFIREDFEPFSIIRFERLFGWSRGNISRTPKLGRSYADTADLPMLAVGLESTQCGPLLLLLNFLGRNFFAFHPPANSRLKQQFATIETSLGLLISECIEASAVYGLGILKAVLEFQVPRPRVIEARLLGADSVLVHKGVDLEGLVRHGGVLEPHLQEPHVIAGILVVLNYLGCS